MKSWKSQVNYYLLIIASRSCSVSTTRYPPLLTQGRNSGPSKKCKELQPCRSSFFRGLFYEKIHRRLVELPCTIVIVMLTLSRLTGDSICSKVFAEMIQLDENENKGVVPAIVEWKGSDNYWKQRASCVSFVRVG